MTSFYWLSIEWSKKSGTEDLDSCEPKQIDVVSLECNVGLQLPI